MTRGGLARAAGLAAVLGGAAAVGAEVVFTRKLALLFGVTAPAAATVVAVFLGGMALGAVLGGRLADRAGASAARVYVGAELFAGLWCVAFPGLFSVASELLDARGGGLAETALATVLLVGPAAVASGATFPGLTRALGEASAVRRLYAANALGAALGGLGVGLWLPEWLGFSGSLVAAAALSCLAAVVVGVQGLDHAPEPVLPAEPDPAPVWVAGVLQAVVGGVGMASEIGWTRLLEQTGPNPGSLCFPLVLAGYLGGLAVGGLVWSAPLARLGERLGLVVGAAASVVGPVVGIALLGVIPEERLIGHLVAPGPLNGAIFDLTGVQVSADRLAVVLGAVALPGAVSGATFPLAARALSRGRGLGQGVGVAGAAGVGAAMAASLWLGLLPVPGWGTVRSLLSLGVVAAVASAVVARGRRRLLGATGAGIALSMVVWVPPWMGLQIPPDEAVVAFVETAAGPSAVAASAAETSVYTHGERVAGLELDLDVPMALHPSPARVLVIALGTGVNVQGLLRDEAVESLTCVDIDPALPLLSEWIPDVGRNVFDDPRAEFVHADGRHLLKSQDAQYDVIFSDVATYAQYVELGTVEFLELARSRLRPGGIFALKLHPDTLSEPGLRAYVATFLSVFPDAALFAPRAHMPVLVGVVDGAFDPRAPMLRAQTQPRVFDARGLSPPGRRVLLGPSGLRELAGNAPVSTDDHPLSLRRALIGPMDARRTPLAASPVLYELIARQGTTPSEEVYGAATRADPWRPPAARPLAPRRRYFQAPQ